MSRDRGTKEKSVSFKEPKQKGIGSETKSSWGSLDIPTSYTVLLLGGRDCFTTLGLGTRSVVLLSFRARRDSPLIWRNVSPSPLRGMIGKSPCSSWGFPGGASGKESTCQCRRHKRCGLDHWVGKISWRRAQQPTPVFLPRESHGQRGLAAYSPWGHTELDMTEMTSWSPITESTRTLEMLASGLKIPEVFKFVIIFLPMSCLFVTIAETRWILVLSRCLYLLNLQMKNFGNPSLRWLIYSVR